MITSEGSAGAASDDSRLRRFWKGLWQLNIPHKVCHFAWRACRDTLPTKENLVRRKVLNDGVCELCNSGLESSCHLFWECSRAHEVWDSLKLFNIPPSIHFSSFMDLLWFGAVEAEWDSTLIEKVVMLAWAIWSSRNERRNGGVMKSAKRLGSDALEYLAEYQESVAVPKQRRDVQPEVWKPPPRGLFKLNVDGAVFADQRAAGVGALIRDEEGNVIGALSKKILAPLKAVEIEAKAVEVGLQFAKDLSVQEFILEGDSLLVINALKDLSPPPSSVAAIISSSLSVSQEFRQVVFSHIRRQGNRPAHLLAKYASGIDDFSVWLEEEPCFLNLALIQDVTFSSLV